MKHIWVVGVLFLCIGADAQTNNYTVTNIVTNAQDPFLINPWGLSRVANPNLKENEWWVSDQGTGLSTLYYANKTGAQSLAKLVVTIPPASGSGTGSPTGTAFNANIFAFSTLDGTISTWNSTTNVNSGPACAQCHVIRSTIMVDHSAQGASYQGLTVAKHVTTGLQTYYAANANGGIEAYDAASFSPVTLPPGAFTDSHLPAGYSPAGVQGIGSRVYVAYNLNSGGGTGFVNAYDTNGKLVLRFKTGQFNQPWGIAKAPANFGQFSNMILVGNTGSGWIGAYSPANGAFQGFLQSGGSTITIPGLWGIGFGNGNVESGPTNFLYFNGGGVNQNTGVFGSISPN